MVSTCVERGWACVSAGKPPGSRPGRRCLLGPVASGRDSRQALQVQEEVALASLCTAGDSGP